MFDILKKILMIEPFIMQGESKNIYNPYSGITHNANESINAKLKN